MMVQYSFVVKFPHWQYRLDPYIIFKFLCTMIVRTAMNPHRQCAYRCILNLYNCE